MRAIPILAGVACGAVLGIGGLVALDAATQTAEAQDDFAVSAGQLQINQKISQAAVRRSNEALNLLGPVREAPAQQTAGQRPNQTGGVRPGTGTGWQPEQIDVTALRSAMGPGGPGPTGPQGPAGPQGAAGATGPRGPSAAWYRERTSDYSVTTALTDVLALDVPAGSFAVTATTVSAGPSSYSLQCNVRALPSGGTPQTGGGFSLTSDGDSEGGASTYAFTTAAAAQVAIRCSSPDAGVEVFHASLLATRVETLTVEPNA